MKKRVMSVVKFHKNHHLLTRFVQENHEFDETKSDHDTNIANLTYKYEMMIVEFISKLKDIKESTKFEYFQAYHISIRK